MKKKQAAKKLDLKKHHVTAMKPAAVHAVAGGKLPASKQLTCLCDSSGCELTATCC